VTRARTARDRARTEVTAEIKDAARARIALEGAPALSLRAVARDLGFVSSAVYRYFSSRDELLTALIVDAYDALGEAAESALESSAGRPAADRWRAVAAAVRSWAVDHRHEYALLYGSPVPGYEAPELTVGPGTRVTLALARVVADAAASGALEERPVPARLAASLARDVDRLGALAMPGVPPAAVVRSLVAWTQLFGMVTFELFGQLTGVTEDHAALFDEAVAETAWFVGLAGAETAGVPDPRPARRAQRSGRIG